MHIMSVEWKSQYEIKLMNNAHNDYMCNYTHIALRTNKKWNKIKRKQDIDRKEKQNILLLLF